MYFLLMLTEKTKEFLFFLEYIQNIYLLQFINFYFGVGFEIVFSEFDIFFGKFIKINNFSEGDDHNFSTKLKILEGFDTSLINNIGALILILLIAVILLLFLTFLRIYFDFQENSIFDILYKKLKWPFFLRILEFSARPILFFSILEISTNKYKYPNDFIESWIGIFMLFYVVSSFFFILKVINYDSRSAEFNLNDYFRKYDAFFEKLNLKGKWSKNYVPIRIFFTFLQVMVMILLSKDFQAQLIGMIFIFLIKEIYILIVKPFKLSFDNWTEFLSILIVAFIYTLMLILSTEMKKFFEIVSIFIHGFIFIGFLLNSINFYISLIEDFPKLKEIFLHFLKGKIIIGLKSKIKTNKFFIEFEEKASQNQNTKENINKEQRQYDAFFMNPSPEISINSAEIAKIALENYVQTELKDNENFENREKKKNMIKIISKSFTTRDEAGAKGEIIKLEDWSFSKRVNKNQIEGIELKRFNKNKNNKIKTDRSLKDVSKK